MSNYASKQCGELPQNGIFLWIFYELGTFQFIGKLFALVHGSLNPGLFRDHPVPSFKITCPTPSLGQTAQTCKVIEISNGRAFLRAIKREIIQDHCGIRPAVVLDAFFLMARSIARLQEHSNTFAFSCGIALNHREFERSRIPAAINIADSGTQHLSNQRHAKKMCCTNLRTANAKWKSVDISDTLRRLCK